MSTLYEKYGEEKISAVVKLFYKNLEKSPTIAPAFQGIDREKLIEFQIEYFKKQMGGPETDLSRFANSPHKLPVSDELFMDVAEILEATLISAKIESEDIETVLSLVAQSRI